jgi:hypothetical protein
MKVKVHTSTFYCKEVRSPTPCKIPAEEGLQKNFLNELITAMLRRIIENAHVENSYVP